MANKIMKKLDRKFSEFVNKKMNSLAQDENVVSGEKEITPGMPEQVRKLSEEGIVLLKNENHTLPIKENEKVSVFGRIQHDWFYVGYGSGGDVHPPYAVDFFEGFQNAGISYNEELKALYENWAKEPDNEANHGFWGHWPYYHEEMPLKDEIVKEAKSKSNKAIVIIGRAAGEDRENKLKEGSYYLTRLEKDMLKKVTKTFEHTILIMDCGNVIDMSFTDNYKIDSIVYAWQLGQENGNALANVLSGKVSPSGKLSDTIAVKYEDYPSADNFGGKVFNNYAEDIFVGYRYFNTFAKDKIKYPFGFGLSYTNFSIDCLSTVKQNDKTTFTIEVKNTGIAAGKEVVQIYAAAPKGLLETPARVLCGYKKTNLLTPNQTERIEITVNDKDFASFDDAGVTGFKDAFVLLKGQYVFYVGNDSLTENEAFRFTLEENILVEQCSEAMSPDNENLYKVMSFDTVGGKEITKGSRDLKQRILDHLPKEIEQTGDQGIKLIDVRDGKHTLEEFIAQLSDEELTDLNHGEGGMDSKLGISGNAGAFGGVTENLRAKGIPAIITADGPAGLRIKRYTTLLPCGTAIACTWNPELTEETFKLVGQEIHHFNVDVNLAPGMNIHRNPLCGRNFEYYAEDPYLSGKTAAATVRGLQAGGTSACPKHFACNNQEYKRNTNDSRVSMRALREIYLKNFEYCVKEADPKNIMTSYNKVNGVWSHYNYDLVTRVLREEWGYQGNVMTDWWMRYTASPEFPEVKDDAYRVRAQVDVLMPGNKKYNDHEHHFDKAQLATLGKPEGLTRAELQRSAANVLRFAMTRL